MTELTYRGSYFLITFLLPFMGAMLLLVINFLFFDDENETKLVHRIRLGLKCVAAFGLFFGFIQLSSWDYLHVTVTILISLISLLVFTLYHMESELSNQSHFQKYNTVQLEELGEGQNHLIQSSSNTNSNKESTPSQLSPIINDSHQENDQQSSSSSHLDTLHNNDDIHANHPISLYWLTKQAHLYVNHRLLPSMKTYWKHYALVLGFVIFLSFFLPLVLEGSCICSHPMKFNTKFSRRFSESFCKSGEICFVYLTLPEDPSSSMILQYQSRDQPLSSVVTLSNPQLNYSLSYDCEHTLSMSDVIHDEPRYISYVELKNLSASVVYTLQISMKSSNKHYTQIQSPLYSFRTLPNDNSPITFATGGDIQLNSDTDGLGKIISNEVQPDFVAIGGDIAYEDGIPACYRRWDEKLSYFMNYFSWNDKSTKSKRLIPLLFSIGNHEAGGFFQNYKKVPFYLKYFLFRLGDVELDPSKRSTYHIHKLSKYSSIVALDSCVLSTWEDQSEWLNSQWSSETYNDTQKYAIYHTPIYPASVDLSNKYSISGRKSIQPIFDSHKVPMVFENHEHLFKRSKPIYNNDVSINGTNYLGGGSYGIASNSKPGNTTDLPWWLEKRSLTNHVWIVKLTPNSVNAKAIMPNGNQLDQLELSFK